MKKKNTHELKEELMLDEYEFDYSKAKQNKFAKDYNKSTIRIYEGEKLINEKKTILIDNDLVIYFKGIKGINNALRSLKNAKKRIYN